MFVTNVHRTGGRRNQSKDYDVLYVPYYHGIVAA
jgi:hypothetical protein